MYIMVLIWPFVPLFSPLARQNGQDFLGLPDGRPMFKIQCPLCKSSTPLCCQVFCVQAIVPVSLPIQKFWHAYPISYRDFTGTMAWIHLYVAFRAWISNIIVAMCENSDSLRLITRWSIVHNEGKPTKQFYSPSESTRLKLLIVR
jgi:hypothetical protein